MVTKISFHILDNAPSTKARDLYACRLVAEAYDNGKKVHIQTTDETAAQSFDLTLWTFNDIAFIPHQICTTITNDQLVSISYGDNHSSGDVLINLTQDIPSFYQNFEQILEIIPNDEVLKSAGRRRYKTYQQNNLVVETFKVAK